MEENKENDLGDGSGGDEMDYVVNNEGDGIREDRGNYPPYDSRTVPPTVP